MSDTPGLQIERPSGPRPKVDLSLTSLILIALIVGVCAGGGNRATKRDLRALEERIDQLEKKIDRLQATQTAAPSPAR